MNAAKRLHEALAPFRAGSSYLEMLSGNSSIYETYRRLNALQELYREVLDEVELLGQQHKSLYQRELKSLAASIFPLRISDHVRVPLSSEMVALESLGVWLPSEEVVPGEKFESLRLAVANLRTAANEDGLPKALSRAMEEAAAIAESAISLYSIFGPRRFQKEYKRIAGEFFVAACQTSPQEKSDHANAWEKFLEVIRQCDTIVGLAIKTHFVIEHTASILPALSLILPGSLG